METEKEATKKSPRYLTVEELSRKLGIPVSKVYRMTRTREIPFYKIGKYCRFLEPEVDEFMKSLRVR